MIDASQMEPTNTKKPLPCRETRVAYPRVGANGQVDQANTLEQKRALLHG